MGAWQVAPPFLPGQRERGGVCLLPYPVFHRAPHVRCCGTASPVYWGESKAPWGSPPFHPTRSFLLAQIPQSGAPASTSLENLSRNRGLCHCCPTWPITHCGSSHAGVLRAHHPGLGGKEIAMHERDPRGSHGLCVSEEPGPGPCIVLYMHVCVCIHVCACMHVLVRTPGLI